MDFIWNNEKSVHTRPHLCQGADINVRTQNPAAAEIAVGCQRCSTELFLACGIVWPSHGGRTDYSYYGGPSNTRGIALQRDRGSAACLPALGSSYPRETRSDFSLCFPLFLRSQTPGRFSQSPYPPSQWCLGKTSKVRYQPPTTSSL